MPRIAKHWFRFYSETLDCLKVEDLSDRQFRQWVRLLMLANISQPRGLLPSQRSIAFALRMKEAQVLPMILALVERGLIDANNDEYVMHDWNEWQAERDVGVSQRHDNVTPTSPERHARVEWSGGEGKSGVDQSEKREEEEEEKSADAPNIFLLYQQSIGVLSPAIKQLVEEAEEEFGAYCLAHCFEEAAANNKRSLKYAVKIAERHQREGCYGNGGRLSTPESAPTGDPRRGHVPEFVE